MAGRRRREGSAGKGGSFLPLNQQKALKGRSLSVPNQKLCGQIHCDTQNLHKPPPAMRDMELAAAGKEPAAPQDVLSQGSFLYKKGSISCSPHPSA